MAEPYEKVLESARQLSPEDRRRLLRELEQPAPLPAPEPGPENGAPRTMYDALMARGLIGCLEDAPPDLSTNPKYMEGFGQHAQ